METIYTIPVNEAFEEKGGCPFCRMHEKLEKNEIELILGASMMEPDTRIKTNEKGFCAEHFELMLASQKRLPLALMLESHIDKILEDCKTPKISLKEKTGQVAEKYASFADNCYICDRIEFHLSRMFETACQLWESDSKFRKKCEETEYFCLPCYTRFLKTAKCTISKKMLPDFLESVQKTEMGYIEKLKNDISWFCKKFDYRFKDEPWNDSKDAIERSIRFLSGADMAKDSDHPL